MFHFGITLHHLSKIKTILTTKQMKTSIKFLVIMLMVLAVGMGFSSCSDDDNGPITDPASVVSGEYVGPGKLEIAGSSVSLETYEGMKIRISKSSNEYVIVIPYMADGKPFFSDSYTAVYQITQTSSGDFKLSCADRPLAQLTISKSGHLDYIYPYVSVGGEGGYALSFSGSKQ